MTDTIDKTTGISARTAGLIVIMMVFDSLFFVWARLMRPVIAPRTSVLYVMLISMVEVGIVAFLQKQLHLKTFFKLWWFFLGIGLLVAASTFLNYSAVAYIDPGTASMLVQFSIVFGLIWGLLWLQERFSRLQLVGAAIAICGVLVITFQKGDYLRLGSLMVLSTAFMYSFHTALVKRFADGLPFFEFFTYRLFSTALFIFLFNVGTGSLEWPSVKAWPLVFLTATIDVAIGRTFYYLVLRRFQISYFSILLTLSPLLTITWSYLLFDVIPTWIQLLGGMGVIAGVLIVTRNRQPV
jgi:O-acetylserine/cysteine efflux transporter